MPAPILAYLVEVTMADRTEAPKTVIGIATATVSTSSLVHVTVKDIFTLLYVVLGGNAIDFFQVAFLASFQACIQANLLVPLN